MSATVIFVWSWNFESATRYVTRCWATVPGAAARGVPVDGSRVSASRGTSTGPEISTARTRFGSQPTP